MADASEGGPTYDRNTGRKCWATARERNRMRARYAIRQRVFGNAHSTDDDRRCDGNGLCSHEDGGRNLSNNHEERHRRYVAQNGEKIREVLRRIVRGDTSYFSILFMEQNFSLLNDAFPVSLVWENIVGSALLEHQRLCSRLGRDGVTLLETYLSVLDTCTVLEYSVWLKRYRIIRQFILGGIDLTIRGRYLHREMSNQPYGMSTKSMGSLVQRRFFADCVPLSLSCYIASRVVELRQTSWVRRHTMNPSTVPVHTKCEVCGQQMDSYLVLNLLANSKSNNSCPFCHQFCERCLWKDILEHLHYRQTDVVACPMCCANNLNDTDGRISNSSHLVRMDCCQSTFKTIRQQRFAESLHRYNELPLDSLTVKKLGFKKKQVPECDMIFSTWSEAVQPLLGRSRTARRDKFLHSTERGSFHYVKGCLDAGVDVNVQNEYGQTALLIAIWLNYVQIVQLLLEYGGDPCVPANGKVTCWSVAITHGKQDIIELLQMAGVNDCGNAPLIPSFPKDRLLPSSDASFSLLIDWSSNHPGAGSFILDDCFLGPFLDSLIALWISLPPEVSAKKKAGPCSERSYYCDVPGTLTTSLSSALTNAASYHDLPFAVDACGPQMRFLSYSESGATLAPHIDLSRTDPRTEARSTHSFLLYLTSCAQGGETSLIGDVTGEGRNVVLARVAPKRGRLLIFPHRCPHEGLVVVDTPKVLVRGELWLRLRNE
jgi:2OG-Fe(II) oxygenase superfamily/Ankyrin repeats (many copies)